jgi:hypothetical protein
VTVPPPPLLAKKRRKVKLSGVNYRDTGETCGDGCVGGPQ